VRLVYLGSADNTTDTNSPNFGSFSLGTAAVDRYIVVCSTGRKSGTAVTTVSSVTVGGAGLSVVRQQSNVATNINHAAIYGGIIATGTSATIVVNYTTAGTMLRTGIDVYALYGLESTTAFDHEQSTASNPSVSLDIPARGVCIGIACTAAAAGATWTGISENSDRNVEASALQQSAASDLLNAETGRTIQASFGTNTNPVLCAASWKFKAPDRVRIYTGGQLNSFSIRTGGQL
jgi:hypothetical protein